MSSFISLIVFPLLLLYVIIFRDVYSTWIPIFCVYLLVLYYIVPWAVISLHLRALWPLIMIGALLLNADWAVAGCLVALLLICHGFFVMVDRRKSMVITNPTEISLYILQGGYSSILNHHWRSLSQRFALDLVGLDSLGRRAKGIYPLSREDYFCFGAKVMSPFSGVVVLVQDGCADQDIGSLDADNPMGNCVIISDDYGRQLVFAHLLGGSVRVKSGDRVRSGDVIGRIGNSGRSTEPHLHIHAQMDVNGQIKGIKLQIGRGLMIRNAIIKTHV